MALLVYVFMFAAAIRLRYSQADKHRSYKIPGGNWVMCLVAGIGIICSLVAMAIGFIPPTQIPVGNVAIYEMVLIGGLVVFIGLPWLFAKKHKKHGE
jgi:amino acid transporter